MSTQENLWAVYGPNGRIRFEGLGQKEMTAKIRFCKEMDGPWCSHRSRWQDWERKGYTCRPVTISTGHTEGDI